MVAPKRLIILLWLVIVAAAAPGSAAAGNSAALWKVPVPHPEKPVTISSVKMTGVDNLPDGTLASVMEWPPADLVPSEKSRVYEPLSAARDVRRIQRIYERYGFFDVSVNVILRSSSIPGGGTVLVFEVHEGHPTNYRRIELRLPTEADSRRWAKALLSDLDIKSGERFSLESYEDVKEQVTVWFSRRARPQNTVEGQVLVYPSEYAADLILRIDPGPEYFFGDVEITGQTGLEENYIKRQLKFKPGQPFDSKALSSSQKALLGSGFFSTAVLLPQYQEAKDGRVPIKITLTDRPAHRLRLGLGYGTEDEMRVLIEQTNRNILGLADELRFQGKISAIYQGLVGTLRVPYVPWETTDVVVRAGVEQPDMEAYQSRNYFAQPVLSKRLGNIGNVWAGYLWERSIMMNLKTDVPDPSYEKQTFMISSLTAGATFDTRNSPLNATKGSLLSIDIEVASAALGSELSFVRPVVEASHVVPIPNMEHWAVAMRVQAGFDISYGETDRIPMIRRFYPGGYDSVRGYPWQCLGPLDSQGKPLGGEAMLVANLELRFPLWGDLGGVVFVDAGNAYEGVNADIGELKYTTGLGLRYNTPVGPLRMDWGFQLTPDPNAEIPNNAFYLSVGQAF